MKKKSAAICLVCVICVPWLLASCVKDELHRTPHPDRGVVSVSVDFPQGAEDEDGYTVEVDGEPLDGSGTDSDPLTPGEHTVLVHNTPSGFTVTDGIAYVERVDGTRALSDLIDPLPEVLYSGTQTIHVTADDTLHLDLSVAQRTRDLRLELTVAEGDPERIASIAGTISGVAGAYDLRNETLYGEAVSTRPTFTRDGDKVTADLRLLGIMGDAQTLSILLTFSNGDTQSVESDLTEVLAGFNGSTEPFALTGNLRTPVEGGFAGSIDGWQQADGGNADAH